MDNYESDGSQNTDDLNQIDDNEEVYEEKVVKGLDRTTNKKVKVAVKKAKPIPIPKKKPKKIITKDLTEEIVEEPVEEIESEPEPEPEPEPVKKNISQARLNGLKKATQAKKSIAKLTKKQVTKVKNAVKKEMPERVIEKTKVIYMIPTNGGFIESESKPRLTKKELDFLENDEIISKQEIEIGKKIIRRKNGTADLRSKREQTAKQKEATQKMVEANKLRRAKKKEEKAETLGQQVKSALIDVVTTPASELKKPEKKIENKPEPIKYDFSVQRFF